MTHSSGGPMEPTAIVTAFNTLLSIATLGDPARVVLVAVSVCLTLAFALLRPSGRLLEEWLVAALLYASSPRHCTWQPREPEPGDWRLAGAHWQELAPSISWADDDGE